MFLVVMRSTEHARKVISVSGQNEAGNEVSKLAEGGDVCISGRKYTHHWNYITVEEQKQNMFTCAASSYIA